MPEPLAPPPTRPIDPRPNLYGRSDPTASFSDYGASRSGRPAQAAGGGGSQFSPYPSVFRDLSNLDLPTDLRGLFAMCRYLAQWSATHKAFVQMMSTFPITDIVVKPLRPSSEAVRAAVDQSPGAEISSEDAAVSRKIELVESHWRLRKAAQDVS